AADITVDTAGLSVDEVAHRVIEEFTAWSERKRAGYPGEQRATRVLERVTVALAEPYDVVVGEGALSEIRAALAGRRQAAIVSQAGVADWHAPALTSALH